MPTRPSQVDPSRLEAWARYRKDVGQRIRSLRVQQGLTQEALALESGVTRNVLIQVEHGRRGLLYERLFDIAEVLGVTAGELLTPNAGRCDAQPREAH
uniref:helix-turn-helix domain-containing protein n=1 Tax=Gordonia sp. B7-2 TaxID=3420932 RepID=UPI003D928035